MALFATKAITSSGEPITKAYLGKMFIVCLSFANLCFLNVWSETTNHWYDFFCKASVPWQKVVAVTLDISIVAVLIWGILYLALASGNRLWIRSIKWVAMAGFLVPLKVARVDETIASMQQAYLPHSWVLQIAMGSLGLAIAFFVVFNWERFSTPVTSSILILLAPSMPIVVANAARQVWAGPRGHYYTDKPLLPALPQPAGASHVIWVIFDEWDQALTFRERPAGLLLPAVDRFQREAFHASRVYPPARMTILSVPSLLTGKTFVHSDHSTPYELELIYHRSEPPVLLTSQSTVFSEARRRGFNIGIAGWYMPYCRLFPECTVCSWSPSTFSGNDESEHSSVLRSMVRTFLKHEKRIPFHNILGLNFEETKRKERHIASYRQLHDDMLRTVTDPLLNLVFVHMNVPHPPAIYLASNGTMSNSPTTTYTDNLRLVDTTISDLRHTLEECGKWDTSAILLTSDHPLRPDLWPDMTIARQPVTQHGEVPYLLKMPGEKQGLAYDKPMQEIVTKDLLLAILNHEVTTSQEVAAWLDRHPPRQ